MTERMRSMEREAETAKRETEASKRELAALKGTCDTKYGCLEHMVLELRGKYEGNVEGLKTLVDALKQPLATTVRTRIRQEVERECAGFAQVRESVGRAMGRLDVIEATNAHSRSTEEVPCDLSVKAAAGGGGDVTARLIDETTWLSVGLAQAQEIRAQLASMVQQQSGMRFKLKTYTDSTLRNLEDIRSFPDAISKPQTQTALLAQRGHSWQGHRDPGLGEHVLPAQKWRIRFLGDEEAVGNSCRQGFDPTDVGTWRPRFEGKTYWEIEKQLQRLFLRGKAARAPPPVVGAFQALARWVECAVADPSQWADTIGMGRRMSLTLHYRVNGAGYRMTETDFLQASDENAYSSDPLQKPLDKARKMDDRKSKPATLRSGAIKCYNCGELGHKSIICPQPTRSRGPSGKGQAAGSRASSGGRKKRSRGAVVVTSGLADVCGGAGNRPPAHHLHGCGKPSADDAADGNASDRRAIVLGRAGAGTPTILSPKKTGERGRGGHVRADNLGATSLAVAKLQGVLPRGEVAAQPRWDAGIS